MLTANGYPVIELTLRMPLSGLWVASLDVASDEALEGSLTLAQAGSGVELTGYVVSSGVVAGTCRLEAVGGAGGLVTDVEARSYQGVTARDVASELLAAVGETLDSSSTRSTVTTSLPYWTRAAGRATTALSRLADALGARWRVRPSGAVWLGLDTFPEYVDEEALELDRDARAGSVLVGAESIGLVPGVTFRGDRVGRVEHYFSRSDPLRTVYWTVP